MRAARAPGTHKKYAGLWRQFEEFAESQGVAAAPADTDTVVEFLVFLANERRGASGGAAVAAIKAYHLDHGLDDPTSSQAVRMATEGAARIAAEHKGWPRERLPFPVEALKHHVQLGFKGDPLKLRDAALVALGLRLMLRPGELARLRLCDVRADGGGVRVRVGKSKADQKGERKPISIEGSDSSVCPVRLLRRWIAFRELQGAQEGEFIFTGKAGGLMSSAAVSSAVRRMGQAAGFAGGLSGHSLRIGGASAALAAGLTVDQVKAVGGWRSSAVNQYLAPVLQSSVSVAMGL